MNVHLQFCLQWELARLTTRLLQVKIDISCSKIPLPSFSLSHPKNRRNRLSAQKLVPNQFWKGRAHSILRLLCLEEIAFRPISVSCPAKSGSQKTTGSNYRAHPAMKSVELQKYFLETSFRYSFGADSANFSYLNFLDPVLKIYFGGPRSR